MKTKKALAIVSLIVAILVVVYVAPWGPMRVKASTTTDSCSGVAIDINASAPASVTVGQAFTVSSISASPATSYGLTITDSTLSLSATGASPSTYLQHNTSTNPSPTTDAPTYTGYFPDWALTATGPAGSKIVIKLVQASVTISEAEQTVDCPLTATLATINVVAAASSGGGSSGSTGGSTKSTAPKETTTDPAVTTTPKATIKDSGVTEDVSDQVVPATILVVNSKKHPIKDAVVTIDGQLTVTTGADGIASFKGIRKGEHTISVVSGNKKVSQNIQAGSNNVLGATIVVPTKPNILLIVFVGLGALVLLGAIVLAIKLYLEKKHQPN